MTDLFEQKNIKPMLIGAEGHVTLAVSSEAFQKIQSLPRINPLFENEDGAVFVEPVLCYTVKYKKTPPAYSNNNSV